MSSTQTRAESVSQGTSHKVVPPPSPADVDGFCLDDGFYSATVELLEGLLRDKPQDYASWFGMGSAHYRAGHYAKAEGCTRQIKYTPRILAVVKR